MVVAAQLFPQPLLRLDTSGWGIACRCAAGDIPVPFRSGHAAHMLSDRMGLLRRLIAALARPAGADSPSRCGLLYVVPDLDNAVIACC
jgi:hypothetical protein